MRSVRVEVIDVLAQHDVEVTWSGDQHVVKAFPAECPDEPFHRRSNVSRTESTNEPRQPSRPEKKRNTHAGCPTGVASPLVV
jgi:hypothetical protein